MVTKKIRQKKRLKTFLILGSIFVFLLTIWLLLVIIQVPYEDTEYYTEQEPYEDTEYYYEREPYTICAGYSFWTGKCNEWKTEYEMVRKLRTITRYRTVQKSRAVTKYCNLWKRISGLC